MPYPEETMHHVLVCKPCNKFPREKCRSCSQSTCNNRHPTHNGVKLRSQRVLICFQSAVSCHRVFNNRWRIPIGVNFRNPFLYVKTIGIEFFGLCDWIKDTEVRGGVATGTGGPLPPAVVRSEIEIEELRGEQGFAPTPIDQQVFRKKTGGDHANTVVHEPCRRKLPHTCVDNRVAGLSIAPPIELFRVVSPLYLIVGDLKCLVLYPREMPEDHLIELAPDQFIQPRFTFLQR